MDSFDPTASYLGHPDAPLPTGNALLQDPMLNKGTAFSCAEREALGLLGLLPAHVSTMADQVERVMEGVRRNSSSLGKYIAMMALYDRNRALFFRVLSDHLPELMPIVYTPTVGQACKQFSHIYRKGRGLYLSVLHRGRMAQLLRNWSYQDVRMVVVTDGERILGLGDLGMDGMGIPVGKLALYTACSGIHPTFCLPVTIDVGTNNEELLQDPLYLGLRQPRLRGAEYDELLEEFVLAVQEVYPKAVIQFEDFANHNAFALLQRYRERTCCFNDDIQGTASVALAGLYAALRLTGGSLAEQTFLFLRRRSRNRTGELLISALMAEGLDEAQARRRCWFVDSRGLVVASRRELAAHKRPFAHDHPEQADLLGAVRSLKPTALIGVSAQGQAFRDEVLSEMAALNPRPIVFALSNPTANAECTAEQAYAATEGRAIFASGSPFAPVVFGERILVPGQGNNVYIFPAIGLAAIATGARHITDEMFLVAARTLSEQVSDADLERGSVYPPLANIREVSARIATAVAELIFEQNLSDQERPADLSGLIRSWMYRPAYADFLQLGIGGC
ncbi:MAG: NAD-dependent malic enzyme [Syntrophotaleaceae bacterium]